MLRISVNCCRMFMVFVLSIKISSDPTRTNCWLSHDSVSFFFSMPHQTFSWLSSRSFPLWRNVFSLISSLFLLPITDAFRGQFRNIKIILIIFRSRRRVEQPKSLNGTLMTSEDHRRHGTCVASVEKGCACVYSRRFYALPKRICYRFLGSPLFFFVGSINFGCLVASVGSEPG